MMRLLLFGLGRMGRSYRSRLVERGYAPVYFGSETEYDLRVAESERSDLAVLAVTNGSESLRILRRLAGLVPHVLDLTTLSRQEVAQNAQQAARDHVQYHAGGVLGGAREAARGEVTILLGGPPLAQTTLRVAQELGHIIMFDTVDAAVTAKLLHNAFTVSANIVLADLMAIAARHGVHDLPSVLERGPAARGPRQASVVRDARSGPMSSYTGQLVAKDIRAMLESFPKTTVLRFLESWVDIFERYGPHPYTRALLEAQVDR